jgi:multidrug efflux pump subunit AcrA (membrane-fusion protein)
MEKSLSRKTYLLPSICAFAFFACVISAVAQAPTDSGEQVRTFPGTLVPAHTAEISPRYNGLLSKINFIPGQFVEQGDLLFEFRTTDQELVVEMDRSKLQRSEAQLSVAELTLKNKQDLHAKKIIGKHPSRAQGRKNSKTTLAACLLLAHLCGPPAKSKPNSQLFSAAQSRDQAGIIFSLAAKMVRINPALARIVTIQETAKSLVCTELGTRYRALSADATTAYGLSPQLVIHDERAGASPRSALSVV